MSEWTLQQHGTPLLQEPAHYDTHNALACTKYNMPRLLVLAGRLKYLPDNRNTNCVLMDNRIRCQVVEPVPEQGIRCMV